MRLLPPLPPPHEVHLWKIPHDLLLLPELPLSQNEIERAQNYHFEKDRRRYLVTQTRKREILGGYLQQTPAELVFTQNPNGRPEVDGLSFSMTHSHDLSILAVAKGGPLGIDLEALNPRPDLDALARHILTHAEHAHYLTLAEDQRLEAFYKFWTAKESYLKALGTGLQIEPTEVSLALPNLNTAHCEGNEQLQLTNLPLSPSYQLHLATAAGTHLFEWQSF